MSSKPSNSAEKSAKRLRGYSLGVEFWSPDFGETGNVFDDRTFLHDVRDQLTAEQRAEMVRADERAKSLYFQHREGFDPYGDIFWLYKVVVLIESERDAATS